MLTLGNLQPRRNHGGKYLPRSTSYSSKIGKTLKEKLPNENWTNKESGNVNQREKTFLRN